MSQKHKIMFSLILFCSGVLACLGIQQLLIGSTYTSFLALMSAVILFAFSIRFQDEPMLDANPKKIMAQNIGKESGDSKVVQS